jgi:hypothetical protein
VHPHKLTAAMHACATDILARSLSLSLSLSHTHTHTHARASPLQLLRRNCEYDTKNAAGKEAWELANEFNYTELGDYIRDKTRPLEAGGIAGAAKKGDDDGLPDLLGERESACLACVRASLYGPCSGGCGAQSAQHVRQRCVTPRPER